MINRDCRLIQVRPDTVVHACDEILALTDNAATDPGRIFTTATAHDD